LHQVLNTLAVAVAVVATDLQAQQHEVVLLVEVEELVEQTTELKIHQQQLQILEAVAVVLEAVQELMGTQAVLVDLEL
jgi:hypothetical protein